MTRVATPEKLTAIVKMRRGVAPPSEYIRMKIGGDIYTIEAYEEDLKEFGKNPNVVSLEYSRPVHQLQKSPALPSTHRGDT